MGRGDSEQGFALVGLVVAIFVILLFIAVAAPRVAQELRREREAEAVHRGNQYVRAVQLYYAKFHSYPGSMEQLEKTNNIRFLRQRYVDPMTGKPDWRLIKLGEAKTTVKGFFGQPLAGMGAPGLGSAAGMASPGGTGAAVGGLGSGPGASAFGSSSFGGSSPGSSLGSSPGSALGGLGAPGGIGTAGVGGVAGASGTDTSLTGPGGLGNQSAAGVSGVGGAFMGVGSSAAGNSILALNEQTTYPTWEFIYDPRIEMMKAKVSLFGGGPASVDATSLGTAGGMNSGVGGAASPTANPPNSGLTPTSPSPASGTTPP